MTVITRLTHPISPHLTYRGSTFEDLVLIVNKFGADVYSEPWERCDVHQQEGLGCPSIQINSETSFLLGEIGLAYIMYRFRDIMDPRDGRLFYRNGRYGELSTLLNTSLEKLRTMYSLLKELYWFTYLDNELMGVLTSYALVTNSHVVEQIDMAELSGRVSRWLWKPTEVRINLRGGIAKRMFHYGVQILNGETGHRALAFRSALWTQSINGMVYEFNQPLEDKGYARHMPTQRLVTTLDNLGASLKENMLAEAFEQLAELPGSWVTGRFSGILDGIKARSTVKEKLSVAFDDDVDLYTPTMAIDMIYQLMETASQVNISAARAAQDCINVMIAQVMHLDRAPGGEVIPDVVEA